MIRAVLLDAGDTLLRQRCSRGHVYAEVLRRIVGVERDPAQLGRAIEGVHAALPVEIDGHYRYSRPWFETFIEETLAEVGVEASSELVRGLFAAFADPGTFAPFEDVRPVLAELRRRGLFLAVVSNWPPHLPTILEGLDLAEAFETITVSARERCEKPSPEIFGRTLRRLGVEAREAVHVGDSVANDVVGAARAGIQPLHLVRIEDPRDHPELPAAPRIPSLHELVGWLDGSSETSP